MRRCKTWYGCVGKGAALLGSRYSSSWHRYEQYCTSNQPSVIWFLRDSPPLLYYLPRYGCGERDTVRHDSLYSSSYRRCASNPIETIRFTTIARVNPFGIFLPLLYYLPRRVRGEGYSSARLAIQQLLSQVCETYYQSTTTVKVSSGFSPSFILFTAIGCGERDAVRLGSQYSSSCHRYASSRFETILFTTIAPSPPPPPPTLFTAVRMRGEGCSFSLYKILCRLKAFL